MIDMCCERGDRSCDDAGEPVRVVPLPLFHRLAHAGQRLDRIPGVEPWCVTQVFEPWPPREPGLVPERTLGR